MSRERMIMMQIVVATVAIAGLARSSRADVLSFTDG